MPADTTTGATLFPHCRALAQQPFQAGEFCLEQGFVNYGADALGERLVGNVTIKASRPSPFYAR